MPGRIGSAVTTASLLAVTLGLEAFGLTNGKTGLILIGLIAVIALSVIAFRVELQWAGVAAACAACFTLTWNGWYLGPLRPGDILVLVALMALAAANPNGAFRTPPWWVKQLGVAVVLVAVLQIYFPPDAVYLSHRIVLNATGQPTVSTKGSLAGANLGVAFKFIVAVVAIPMVFVGAALVDRRAIRWLTVSFVTGAAVSGAVATVDHFGANIGAILTKVPNVGTRQLGFSDHPNFLAAGLTLAVPLAYWMIASGRRFDTIVGAGSMLGLLGGVYASGSRGGAVCVVLAIVMCIVLHPRTRVHAPTLLLAGVVLVGFVIAAVPALGNQVLKATRLAGGASTAGSDSVRAIVGAQGIRDFHFSPLKGIGLQASFDASQVYIQELAAGGLILFVGMSLYMLGGIVTSFRLMKRYDLASALLASALITLALNVFEADLTDRFYYVPEAILIALLVISRQDAGVADPSDDADDDADEPASPVGPLDGGDAAPPDRVWRTPAHTPAALAR